MLASLTSSMCVKSHRKENTIPTTTGRISCAATEAPHWYDSLGREVDLDNIDREYALNILSMVLLRKGRLAYTSDDLREDPLIQKLREVILTGREPNAEDRRRAMQYNIDNVRAGMPFRAPVR